MPVYWASLVAQWSRVYLQCRRHELDPQVGKIPLEGMVFPTTIFLLDNPMDREAWGVVVQTQLNNWARMPVYWIICYCLVAQLCPTLCDPMVSRTPGFLILYFPWSLLKLMSIELIKSSNHLIPCCRLLLLPSIFPSIKVFSDESTLHIKWANWELQFSFSLPNENSELISFSIDWFDL